MMSLLRDSGVTRPARGPLVGTVLSILFHVLVLIVVLTVAPRLRLLVSLDTGDRGVLSHRTIQSDQPIAAPEDAGATRLTLLARWLRHAWEALAATIADLTHLPRVRLAMEKLLDHVWQSTLVAMGVGLLALACRRNQARVRYALWLGASLKFFVPFALLTALGSQIAWPRALALALATEVRPPIITAAIAPATWVMAMSPRAAASLDTRDWRGLVLLGVWGCGCLAVLVRRLRASLRVRETLEASAPMDLSSIGLPPWVQVRSAPGLLEPGVVGWRDPVLLMPADIAQHLTPPELQTIVAHELCHVRRRDNFTASLHMAAEAVFWFYPLVWWIGGRLIDERERACDEDVLDRVDSPHDYARGILKVCKRYAASPLASVSGVGSANVRARIEAILAHRVGQAMGWPKRLVLGTIIALVILVPVSVGAMHAAQVAAAAPLRRAVVITSYALVLADADGQLGPHLRHSRRSDCDVITPDVPPCGSYIATMNPGLISGDSLTIAQLADLVARATNRSVIQDRTGLTGRFSVELRWDVRETSVTAALEDQLGLRLEPVLSGQ
jgi:beta-lactamase regulating signal transducer with metallopeptidase domain